MKKPRSLRAALFRLVVIQATIILVILLGMIALGFILIQNQIIERQQVLIDTLARQGDQYLDETNRFMRAQANTIKNLPAENRQHFLTQTRIHYPRFATLYLVDENGKVLVEDTDATTLLGLDLSNTQFFDQARESGHTFFSEPFISLATGEIVVTSAIPVYNNNQFAGMLVGELYLSRLQDAIEQVDIGEEGISFIVDQRGTLVAYPNQQWVQEQRNLNNLSLVQKGLAGGKTFEIFYENDQKEWLIGSVTPMGQNWAVVATQPAILVFRPLQILLTASVFALVISFALYALSQRYIAKQIISPISVLAQKVDALSGGQYEPLPVDQMGEFSEIITLGQSFNRMVGAVAERTEKLMAVNQSLRESEANLARAQRIAHLGSYSWNTQTDEIFWSEELKLITGLTAEEPSFGLTNSMIHPDDYEQFSRAERLTLEEGHPFDIEYRIIKPDGLVRYIHDQAEVIRDEDGKAIEMIGTSLDITERKEAEYALRESEARFRQIAENIPEVFWLSTPDWTEIHYINPAYEKIWGRKCEELYQDANAWLESVVPEDRQSIIDVIAAREHNDMAPAIFPEYRILRADGTMRWIAARGFPVQNESGEVHRIVGIAEDITERKQAQEKIQASLHEKEALLREIHHRVKNNLQVVCALLDLQAETIADPRPREAFQESRNRVRSMAQIHEQLTHNENLAQVNMASYIEELVSSLRIAYGTEEVAIRIEVSDVTLPFDSVSPCGLLINELVSNAMKHAFPASASPGQNKIQIMLQQLPTNNQMLELTVADNGVGLPDDVDLTNPDSLGLTLVNLLIRQLSANLNVERDSGTTFRIVFSP